MPHVTEWMPHGFCFAWEPWVAALYIFGDGFTGLAYMLGFPYAGYLLWSKLGDVLTETQALLLCAFVIVCGLGHWSRLYTLWVPSYGVDAHISLSTAVVSWTFVFFVWRTERRPRE